MPRLDNIDPLVANVIRELPVWTYDKRPFAVPKRPVDEMTIALVTTAALVPRGERSFGIGDTTWRALPDGVQQDEVIHGHGSIDIDRASFAEDVDVVFPLERLHEAVADGQVGAAAKTHYSFAGGIFADAAPRFFAEGAAEVAQQLVGEGVDGVILMGVCPVCTQSTAAAAWAFEDVGVASVVISQVRELSERLGPPRTLFVPFPFGRPFGRANEPELQRRVLDAALALLRSTEGPVIEDFPEEIDDGDDEHLACPVMILSDPPNGLRDELQRIVRAHAEATARLGRTNVGLSGLTAKEIVDAVDLLVDVADAGALPEPGGTATSPLEFVRTLVADVKALYIEASLSQSSGRPTQHDIDDWFWTATEVSGVLRRVRDQLIGSDDSEARILAMMIVPYHY